jgi:hypothetical protein
LSSDKLKDFWKPIILAARKERQFFSLMDKLKPIILDQSWSIKDTVETIGELMSQEFRKKEALVESQLTGRESNNDSNNVPLIPDGIFESQLPDELINNNDFPVMIHHGIDCHDVQAVHALLCELGKLNDMVSSQNIFTFDQKNRKQTSMVRVPMSTKYKSFVRNAPAWLPKVLDAVCPETAEDNDGNDEDRLGHSRDDAAQWLLTYLGSKWPTEFAQASAKIGMPVSAKTMGSYWAFAMWGDANITLTQQ